MHKNQIDVTKISVSEFTQKSVSIPIICVLEFGVVEKSLHTPHCGGHAVTALSPLNSTLCRLPFAVLRLEA